MPQPPHAQLSRREREIMDIVYRLEEASVADVAGRIPDDPGYDSIRVTLGILEKKGHVSHRQEGRRYLYHPTVSHAKATKFALRNVLRTFFGDSPSRAVLTLLDMSAAKLSPEELDEIRGWVESEQAKDREAK